MIDEFSTLFVVAQNQGKGQYYETGDNHIVQSFKILGLEHDRKQGLLEMKDLFRSLFRHLIFFNFTFRDTYSNILRQFLPELFQGQMYVFIKMALCLQNVNLLILHDDGLSHWISVAVKSWCNLFKKTLLMFLY